MIRLAKYHKTLTLLLCLFYIFSGSGLDKLSFQLVSMIPKTIAAFPCKGKGCQCDKAGYELTNCSCEHENNISCCPVEEADEVSCGSDGNDSSKDIFINMPPCQGIEEENTHSQVNHLILSFSEAKSKFTENNNTKTSFSFNYSNPEINNRDKVPI